MAALIKMEVSERQLKNVAETYQNISQTMLKEQLWCGYVLSLAAHIAYTLLPLLLLTQPLRPALNSTHECVIHPVLLH